MNLLIVDDERMVIEDILESVDWESAGVTNVMTAQSAAEARRALEGACVDLMICDIEMPGMSGLALLAWMRRKQIGAQVILLTCHASFSFAKEAVRLQCVDYLIKPADADLLTGIIRGACARVLDGAKARESIRMGGYWMRHRIVFVEKFWQDVISGAIQSTAEELRAEANRRDLPYSIEKTVIPLLVSVKHWHEMELQRALAAQHALKKTIYERFSQNDVEAIVVSDEVGTLLALASADGVTAESLRRICRQILPDDTGDEKRICFYIGNACRAEDVFTVAKRLGWTNDNNVRRISGVWLEDELTAPNGNIPVMDLGVLSSLLHKGETDEFMRRFHCYYNEAVAQNVDRSHLASIQTDVLQMICCVLNDYGLRAHRMLQSPHLQALYVTAADSIADMQCWLCSVLDSTVSILREARQAGSVVSQTAEYIEQHPDEDLFRERLAGMVFMNPDYLDRLFRREKGMSVNKYVLGIRIRLAERLLSTTDLSISEISMRVGYSSMSNFSAMFKRNAGVTPFDFRQALVRRQGSSGGRRRPPTPE